LGARKDIQLVSNFTPASHKGSLKDLKGPGLSWSDLRKDKRVKQKSRNLVVVIVVAGTAAAAAVIAIVCSRVIYVFV